MFFVEFWIARKYTWEVKLYFREHDKWSYSVNLLCFKIKHNSFKNYFFPLTVIEWNKLDLHIRDFESFSSNILKFIRFSENSVLLCSNPKGIQLMTRLRIGLSHLQEHKLKQNFQDTFNPIWNYSEDIKTLCHYLLYCSLYTNKKLALLNVI